MATLTLTAAQAVDRVRAICALLERWHWDPTPQQADLLLAALPGWIVDETT